MSMKSPTYVRLIWAVTAIMCVVAVVLGLRVLASSTTALSLPPLQFVQHYAHKGCGPFGFLTLNPCYKVNYYTVDRPFEEFSPAVVSTLQAQGYHVNYDPNPENPTYAFRDGRQLYIDFDAHEFYLELPDSLDSRLTECRESKTCSVVTVQF